MIQIRKNIIAEIVDEYTVNAIDKNKNKYPLSISDIEIGDYADMLKYEKYPPLFLRPQDLSDSDMYT